MISGLILAAGESSRMNTPKALLQIQGQTFAECIFRKMQDAGIRLATIVTGAHHAEIEAAVKGKLRLEVVFNPLYQEGQLSSLKEGVRLLPTGSNAALIWPVDQPLVQTETVKKLMDTFQTERKRMTIPVYDERHGHPIICDMGAIRALLELRPTQTAKVLQQLFADQISFVEVDDSGVTLDIDTPEEYQKYITS
jgi:molybdenum cofactor cytidylyltransferase